MSPTTTLISSAPGLRRNCSSIASEMSIPETPTPVLANGNARRPVPTANSTAGPPRASSAKTSTAASNRFGTEVIVVGVVVCSRYRRIEVHVSGKEIVVVRHAFSLAKSPRDCTTGFLVLSDCP